MPSAEFPNVPTGEHMTAGQMLTLTVLERTGGCISLVAVLAIFVAYGLFPEVRNVQNIFIVFASVSNVGASIASAIAMGGLVQGRESSLCQAQSFMFEMFMQSDPWWSLAMSINVFLVFFFRTSPDAFQQWWWLYCLVCYGGPFVIALVLLLIRHPERGPVYGEATIWCWVDREWDDIRIYTYYMLIWVCILGSLIFYTMVGYHVFHSRNRLQSFSTNKSRDREATQNDDGEFQGSKIKLPSVPQDGFYGTVITEVQVVHSNATTAATAYSKLPIEPRRTHAPALSFDECSRGDDNDHCHCGEGLSHDIRRPVHGSQYATTVTTAEAALPPPPKPSTPATQVRKFFKATKYTLGKFVVEDPVKAAYLRTSFLFALSVLVTWIPSSMNRIHSWVSGQSPFEYHVATAAVLPLQGLWNAVIFFVTSIVALRKGWGELRQRRRSAGGVASIFATASAVQGAAAAAANMNTSYGGDAGLGMSAARRSAPARHDIEDSSDGEMGGGALDSDVELRRMAESPGKISSSSSI